MSMSSLYNNFARIAAAADRGANRWGSGVLKPLVQLLTARFGERYTIPYILVFAFICLFLLTSDSKSIIYVNYTDGVSDDWRLLPEALEEANAQIDDILAETGGGNHPHLIGWPVFARLFNVSSYNVWVIYPFMLALLAPAFWLWLAYRHRVPLLVATCLVLYIWRSPLTSHIGIQPTSDLFLAIAFIGLFLFIHHYRGRFLAVGFLFFFILLIHQRAAVMSPAVILWAAYCWHDRPGTLKSIGVTGCVKTASPVILAIAAFFIYKELFYTFFPSEFTLSRLDISQQFRQLFRIPSEANLEGGVFHYVLSPGNWTAWGLYYFSFVPLAIGGLLRKDQILIAIALVIHLGAISQLLVAQDVSRLTDFLFINLLILAILGARGDWPIKKLTLSFFLVGFLWTFGDRLLFQVARLLFIV